MMILKQKDLTIDNLEKCFNSASQQDQKYVGVLIEMQGFPRPEVIINENANFDSKFAYYKKAYNEDLTLKTFNGIKIIGFTHGNEFADIEHDLLMPK
jgi:hypothetical protein